MGEKSVTTLALQSRCQRAALNLPVASVSEYARRRATMHPTEWTVRRYEAEEILNVWLERRHTLNLTTAAALDYAKASEPKGATKGKPAIADALAWVIDIEKALLRIGWNDALILLARVCSRKNRAGGMKIPSGRWSDICARFNITRTEAEHRFELAIIHFTDELRRTGLTTDPHHRTVTAAA
jgi:hypothetical protein